MAHLLSTLAGFARVTGGESGLNWVWEVTDLSRLVAKAEYDDVKRITRRGLDIKWQKSGRANGRPFSSRQVGERLQFRSLARCRRFIGKIARSERIICRGKSAVR
jgi:hypothetical protein